MRPLLEINGLTKTLGGRVLFDGASLVVGEGQRVAVVGRNGAGKTTLFRMILGQEAPDAGEIRLMPGLRLGWVEQHDHFEPGETVAAYLERESGKPAWACAKMAARFQLKGAWLERPCLDLSGGYRMRVKLSAMLLRDPNLLLLDEPTNYLDLATLLLLEEFLRTFRGGYLAISHDRQFLKNTCLETLDVAGGALHFFPGPLEEYFAQKEQELAWKLKANRKVEDQRQRLQSFVDRFRAKESKARQAQSKLKQLRKLQTIDIEHAPPVARIRLPAPAVSKGYALRTTRLGIGYPDRPVASGVEFDVQRGEHVALVGDNGQGKTTLLKTLAGALPPREGWFRWWPKARVGFYSQHVQDMLRPTETVEAYLRRCAPSDVRDEDVLRMAGDFLFRDDDLEKPARVLSGGEKARLCLAGILLQRHDVLLLDEPTNHLDVETTEALADALREYPGTVLFVSHDRTFVHIVADRLLEVRDGAVRQYPGTYEEYVQAMQEALGEREEGEAPDGAARIDKEEARQRHERHREIRRELARLERNMADWDKKKSALLAFFFDNPLDYDPEKRRQLEEAQNELEAYERRWYELQQELEG